MMEDHNTCELKLLLARGLRLPFRWLLRLVTSGTRQVALELGFAALKQV